MATGTPCWLMILASSLIWLSWEWIPPGDKSPIRWQVPFDAFKRWIIRVEKESLESVDENADFREQLNVALKQLTTFDFDAAKKKFAALCQQYPDDISIKIQLFHLEKLFRNAKGINRLAFEIFDQGVNNTGSIQSVHDLYCEYLTLEDTAAIPYALDVKLLLTFIQQGQLDTSKKLVKHLMSDPEKDVMLVKALNILARSLERDGKSDDAYRYKTMADELQAVL